MNTILTRKLMDSFHEAALSPGLMPPLPDGMKSQYVHIIDAISQIGKKNNSVRLSDVASFMNVTLPGITRSVNALERLGAVRKLKDPEDRRAIRLELTDKGRTWVSVYVEEYHSRLADLLESVPEKDALTTIRTIDIVIRQMQNHPITLHEEHDQQKQTTRANHQI